MRAFEDGQRVRHVAVAGFGLEWSDREGVVLESYRDYDGYRVTVQFDGEDRGISFEEDDLEAVKTTYEIENFAEDSTSMSIALTDREAALIRVVIEGLNVGKPTYAPTLEMKRRADKQ